MKKVIVTGATGFIGKALIKNLSENNIKVYAIVRNINNAKDIININNVELICCNMSEVNQLKNLINNIDIDVFYHLAWSGTSGDLRMNYDLQLMNVKYTCDAVKLAKDLGCNKFVFAGSIMEHESIKYVPEDGSYPSRHCIYKTAKLAAHYMGKTMAANIGIDFINAIISNVYGEGEISQRLISSTIKKLLNGEKTSFTSGEQLYDFIYITDAARAFMEIGLQGKPFHSYYIGSGEPMPLKHFLTIIRDCIDKNIDLGLGKVLFDGSSLSYNEFDKDSLFREFNFKCEVSFTQGIIKTIDWMKSLSL